MEFILYYLLTCNICLYYGVFTTVYKGPKNFKGIIMLFSSFKNLVSFFRQSDRGLTKSNISNQFCKPIVGLCALLCMSLWISAAQAQQMKTALAQNNRIPASYTDSNSPAQEITATLGVTGEILDSSEDTGYPSFNDNDTDVDDTNVGLVDWVEVQIRIVANADSAPTSRPSDVNNLYIKAAWLLSDGSVVDVDSDIAAINDETEEPTLTIPTGTDGLEFDEGTQDLYVLVNHRNHLPIMSNVAVVADAGGVYDYDFITGLDQAVSGTAKEVGGRFFMYAGDSVGFGAISVSDVNNASLGTSLGGQFDSEGYLLSDYNLSGNVNVTDVNIVNFGVSDTPSGNFDVSSPLVY